MALYLPMPHGRYYCSTFLEMHLRILTNALRPGTWTRTPMTRNDGA